MSSPLEYVKVNVDFQEDGVFLPRSLELELQGEDGKPLRRKYLIDRVLSSEYLPCEEYEPLFGSSSSLVPSLVYKYRVLIGGRESTLYFDRWPESGVLCLGRWFVVRKQHS